MVHYTRASKKIKHVLIALILNKSLHKPTKTRHQWTPQLIRSMLGVRIVNKTKLQVLIYDAVEMKCLSWFLCWNRLCFWLRRWILRQDYSLIDLAGNGEYSKPNPFFVACFSPKIWSSVSCDFSPYCYCTNWDINSSNCLML